MQNKKNSFLKGVFFFLVIGSDALATCAPTQKALHLLAQDQIEAAESLLIKQTNKKDGEAAFYLSQIKLFGKEKNIEEGLNLLRQSIKLGFTAALDALAGYYLHGEFFAPDAHAAALYYKIAAKQGYGPAQFNYGIMNKNGEKIPKDLEEAFIYLALAALNTRDLDELTQDAAYYRDTVAAQLTPLEYTRALRRLNKLIKIKSVSLKKANS